MSRDTLPASPYVTFGDIFTNPHPLPPKVSRIILMAPNQRKNYALFLILQNKNQHSTFGKQKVYPNLK
jgi:hypothetical protein